VSAAAALLAAVDRLYRRAVEEAALVDDACLAGWLEDTAALLEPPVDRMMARQVRAAARRAARLARYWSRHDPDRLPDWRNGVDEVLGSAGWQPALAIARRGLELDPSPDAFREVQERFRAVHFRPWMEGITFEEYLKDR
jgi:hypothetical protein